MTGKPRWVNDVPLFSVVVPTYNYGRFLSQCIDSVLAQDCGDWELIITDDQSADDTSAVIARYSDPRIHYIRNERRLGMYPNFRRAIEMSRGTLIKPLPADDYLLPGSLSSFAQLFAERPAVVFASAGAEICDWEGHVIDRRHVPGAGSQLDTHGVATMIAEAGCFFGGNSTFAFRRAAYETVGGYPEGVRYSGDFALGASLSRIGDYFSVPQILIGGRLHGVQSGVRDTRGTVHIEDRFAVYRLMYAPHPSLPDADVLHRRAQTRETAMYAALALKAAFTPGRREWARAVRHVLARESDVAATRALLTRAPALIRHFVKARRSSAQRQRAARRTSAPGMSMPTADPSVHGNAQ
jgi:glycosyltransferase involved in cell wall biosynthesis